ncbi:MAG TPA: hypothetical protein VMZ50_14125 [Phycisphaerae bacterium]|nr:hypothetical protein [Phycisphaerae bacterium]
MRAMKTFRVVLCLGLLGAIPSAGLCDPQENPDDVVWWPFTPVEVKANVLETRKHRITVDPSGLPAQITIKPDPQDLPLAKRDPKAKVTGAELAELGRGPQLRAPMRLEVDVGGTRSAGSVVAAAAPTRQWNSEIEYASKLKVGPIDAELVTQYDCDGAVTVRLTYSATAKVDSFELVMELGGVVDMACAGLPAGGKPGEVPYEKLDVTLSGEEGVIWDSAKDAAAARGGGPLVRYLYVGSGDRGFTWLCDEAKGWALDAKVPAMTLERDKVGQVTWRVKFINHAERVSGRRTVEFALLTHPAKPKEKGFRRVQWLTWRAPGDRPAGSPKGYRPDSVDGIGRTTLAARKQMKQAARALAAGKADNRTLLWARTAQALESCARDAEMTGSAAADMLSREKDNVALYPISLFRFMAATSTGLTARIRSNPAALVRPGDDPRPGRIILGRALLHDIGVDPGGLVQPLHFVRLVKVLKEFGYFEDDNTEVIPYWRGKHVVRYGEAFETGSEFEVTKKDPYARVHVTVYRRPVLDGRGGSRGYHAMFVIMNESDQPVRERLFILDPARVFGGANRLMGSAVVRTYDFSRIEGLVPTSDWRKGNVEGIAKWRVLKDLEDGGLVRENTSRGRRGEIYGPLHVLPHDYRIVYGMSTR